MKHLTMTWGRKELAARLTVAMICTVQNTIVLTASLMERIQGILRETEYELNMPSYALGFLILLLLFAVFTLPSKHPLIISLFLTLLLNLIGVIN